MQACEDRERRQLATATGDRGCARASRLLRGARSVTIALALALVLASPALADAHPPQVRPPSVPAREPIATAAQEYKLPQTQAQQEAAEKKAANRRAELADKVGDGLIGLGGAMIGAGAVTALGAPILVPIGACVAAAGAGAKIGAAIGKYLWGDPRADRRFRLIAKPLKVHLAILNGPASVATANRLGTRYLQAELQLTELGVAFQTSLNRAIGAHAAHSKTWTRRQLATAARYANRGAAMFARLAATRAALAQALQTSGAPQTFATGQSTVAQRAAAADRVLASLPRAATRLLQRPPLRRFHILAAIRRQALAAPPATVTLGAITSTFVDPKLALSERRLAENLRSFGLLVKDLKPGALPAGLR